jgi:RNA polymerase sigma-70 factor (ECF subfamily)
MLPHGDGVIPNPEPPPDASVKNADLQAQVNWVLSGMSPKLREVLVLVEMEEMRPQDVAEILGIPSNTVRSRRRLAHEEFQRRWQQYVEVRHDD